MNLICLSGRLTKANELRITPNGKEVLQNTLAVKREFKNANGEVESDFINIVMFGVTAKFINDYAPKGSLIEVRGRWQNRSYQNNQGNTIYVSECIVESASLLVKYEAPQQNNQYQEQQNNQNQSQQNQQEQNPFEKFKMDDLPF